MNNHGRSRSKKWISAITYRITYNAIAVPTAFTGERIHVETKMLSANGAMSLYVDGVDSSLDILPGSIGVPILGGGFGVMGQQQAANGGSFDPDRAFQGQLDEFRMWNVVRSQEEIAAASSRTLAGDEEGLVLYWPMDDGEQPIVTDYSKGGTYGRLMNGVAWATDTAPLSSCGISDDEGNYFINNIRYGASSTFRVTPVFAGRQFDPAFKPITLNPDSPIQNEVAFNDISSFSVEGFVQFSGTDLDGYVCPSNEIETSCTSSMVIPPFRRRTGVDQCHDQHRRCRQDRRQRERLGLEQAPGAPEQPFDGDRQGVRAGSTEEARGSELAERDGCRQSGTGRERPA